MPDVVVIGGGHNGLTAAAYLAAAGLKVAVLERRSVVGGAAATEEFHPGFRNSVAAYAVSLLNPKVVRDLELERHGLKIVPRPISNFLPLPDGGYLKAAPGRTKDEVRRFSLRDAERLEAYEARLERMADVLRALALETPPNVATGRGLAAALREGLEAARAALRLKPLGLEGQRDLVEIFTRSAGDVLDQWFESDPIKALLGFDGIVGTYAGPYGAGTAYVLLHHCFGEIDGKKGLWGHAIGGMGAVSAAMAGACAERGVEIRTRCGVREILVAKGRAAGVVTESGETIAARAVVSNVHPKIAFERLLDPAALPTDFRARIASYRSASGVFRMNVALGELPSFSCLPGHAAEHHGAGIVIAPSLAYMERAFMDARANGCSSAPIIEMLIPSALDDTLAPSGRHVASLFCQYVAPKLPDGRSWDESREAVADRMIDAVEAYAPGFRASVIARKILTPLDLERDFGLVGGDIFHGRLSLDQLYSARPVLGHADYRSPVPGLYMCGASTHPGGGVTGAPGHNAAREVLKDLGRAFRA
ncbi:MAG: NAD(P)/FAD-dependent oxidoreductase [Hyphomicrobiales bacterium]|nr:NAD(P)/FAD-dependent oxidoreductase [Hyphomicrobiales bacterium]